MRRVIERIGFLVRRVKWELGLLKVGGEIGVIGDRYL